MPVIPRHFVIEVFQPKLLNVVAGMPNQMNLMLRRLLIRYESLWYGCFAIYICIIFA